MSTIDLKALIQRTAKRRADSILLYAVPGWGKTTFASYMANALFCMCKGDTGLLTLLANGLVPETDYLPVAETWEDLNGYLDEIASNAMGHRTLVIDTGWERLMHESVCAHRFDGDWGEKGFTGYQRGYDIAARFDLRSFLARLDRIRNNQGVTTVLLAHCVVKPKPNPSGENFQAFMADLHEKTFGLVNGWAEMVLFGNYYRITTEGKRQKESTKKQVRVLYTEETTAFAAKNRHGLPPEIYMPDNPAGMVDTFRAELKKAMALKKEQTDVAA